MQSSWNHHLAPHLWTGRGVLLSALLVLGTGLACQNNEAPPPLPEAKPATTPPVATLEVPEEPEPEEEPEAKTGKRRPSAGAIGACCAALAQNAVNAPPETQAHLQTAAATCSAANNTPAAKAFLSGLSSMLKGAGMPAACK